MGRFFQAQPVELNRDFIYQPPLELMAQALLKKDDDIQQQADTMELMRSLPIDFIDYHKDGVENIKKEINSDIDNLAKEIMTKGALDGSLKSKINAYKNQLQERYSTGDIYNIQQTKKNYEEFEKKLEATKGLTSAQKEKHKQEYWGNYTKENPDGGYKSVYTPGTIIDDVDYLGEYSDWFSKLKPDQKKNIIQKLGGRYDTMTETERNGLILENGHETFLQARPDLQELLKQQGQSNIFKDRDIRFNQDGNLNYKEGFLGNLGKAAKEMNYINTLDSKTYNVNQYAYREEGWAYEASKERLQKAQELGGLQLETNIRTEEQKKYLNKEYYDTLLDFLKNDLKIKPELSKDGKTNKYTIDSGRKQIEKDRITFKNSPERLALLDKKEERLNLIQKNYKTKMSNASWLGAGEILGINAATQVKKDFDERYGSDPSSLYSKRMEEFTINGKKYFNVSFNDIINKPEKFGLPEDTFHEIDSKTNKKGDVKGDLSKLYNPKSVIPVVYSRDNWDLNDMMFDFNFNGNSIEAKTSFTKIGIDKLID